MRKVKKYAEGGITINQQTPVQTRSPGLAGYESGTVNLYPTRSGDGSGSATSSGTNQTFNIQPQATAGQPSETITAMKRGGSVRSSASKRADGCAVRGKTRA
jgi:hypothetical protein